METFLELDRAVLLWLNGLHTPWADDLMTWWTNKYSWLVPAVVLVVGVCWKLKRRALLLLLLLATCITCTDRVTSGLLKPTVQRPRPCHDETVRPLLHLVNNQCGGRFGFASSHAANSAALAGLVGLAMRSTWPWLVWVLGAWAFVNSYSRLYLGVHYPSDVLAGWAIGLSFAAAHLALMRWACKRFPFFSS
jgi:undecaprenyl-diphosphatase